MAYSIEKRIEELEEMHANRQPFFIVKMDGTTYINGQSVDRLDEYEEQIEQARKEKRIIGVNFK